MLGTETKERKTEAHFEYRA